jgi:hypothetical protein
MAKRLKDTDIWDKEWFMKLSPKLKCLTQFVWDKCDLSGTWIPNWVLAKIYIGEDVNEAELLNIDNGKQFIKVRNKVFCMDFIKFQNGELGDKSKIHLKIWSLLKHHNIPYPIPTGYPLDTDLVEVGVLVKVKVEVKEWFEKIFETLKNDEIWLDATCKASALPWDRQINHKYLIDKTFIFCNRLISEGKKKSLDSVKSHHDNWFRIQVANDPEIIRIKNAKLK